MTALDFFKHYMENTLGLRYFPFEAAHTASTGAAAKLLVIDLPWAKGLAQVEMFQKMMGAIGLAMTDLEILEMLPGEAHHHVERIQVLRQQGVPVLFFSPDIHKAMHLNEDSAELAPVIVTYGPRDIERNAGLKRETWGHLQSLQKSLQ